MFALFIFFFNKSFLDLGDCYKLRIVCPDAIEDWLNLLTLAVEAPAEHSDPENNLMSFEWWRALWWLDGPVYLLLHHRIYTYIFTRMFKSVVWTNAKKGEKLETFLSFVCIACIPLFLSSLFAFGRHQKRKIFNTQKKGGIEKGINRLLDICPHVLLPPLYVSLVFFSLSLSLLCWVNGSVSCLWKPMESRRKLTSSSLFDYSSPCLFFCSHHLPFALIVDVKG